MLCPRTIGAVPAARIGIAGTRRLTGVAERRAGRHHREAQRRPLRRRDRRAGRRLCAAGVDFIKDDEVCADPDPLAARRARAGRDGRRARAPGAHRQAGDGGLQHHRRDRRHAAPRRPGRARRRHLRDGQPQLVRALGRPDAATPTRASRCTAIATARGMSRHPLLGIGFQAYQTLWRLAGVDHMHVHGLQGKFAQADEEVDRPRRTTASRRWPSEERRAVMPAFSSGQWAGTVPATWAAHRQRRPAVHVGRRHPRAPRRPGRRRRQHPPGLGGRARRHAARRCRARARPSCAHALEFFGKVSDAGDRVAGQSSSTATTSPAPPTRWPRLARAGLRTVLFLGVPTPRQLARAGPLDCLGIAGAARSMAPDAMRAELAPVGALVRRAGARACCTTRPARPSTARPTSAASASRSACCAARVRSPFVPIVGGQPNLGRYCVFGNLFAAAGAAARCIASTAIRR